MQIALNRFIIELMKVNDGHLHNVPLHANVWKGGYEGSGHQTQPFRYRFQAQVPLNWKNVDSKVIDFPVGLCVLRLSFVGKGGAPSTSPRQLQRYRWRRVRGSVGGVLRGHRSHRRREARRTRADPTHRLLLPRRLEFVPRSWRPGGTQSEHQVRPQSGKSEKLSRGKRAVTFTRVSSARKRHLVNDVRVSVVM